MSHQTIFIHRQRDQLGDDLPPVPWAPVFTFPVGGGIQNAPDTSPPLGGPVAGTTSYEVVFNGKVYQWDGSLYRVENGTRVRVTDRNELEAVDRFIGANMTPTVHNPSTGMYENAGFYNSVIRPISTPLNGAGAGNNVAKNSTSSQISPYWLIGGLLFIVLVSR